MQDLWFCESELCEDVYYPVDLEEFGRFCWRRAAVLYSLHGIIYHSLPKHLPMPLDNAPSQICPLRLLPLQELVPSIPRPA
jgi:hypothetical protein